MSSSASRAVARRLLAATTSALILVGAIMPGATLAAAGGPPVPTDDYVSTYQNIATSGNVLANDKNPGSGTLTVTGFTAVAASVGSLTVAPSGAYSFTPALNWTGSTSATYTVANATKTRTGTIFITVRTTNAAPVANDDSLTLVEGQATDVTALILANDTDADGDALFVTAVSGATGGTVDLTSSVVTFTLDANVCGIGAAGFDYTIDDGFGVTSTARASADILCVNDVPVAVADTLSGTEDTALVVDSADLTANDADADSDDLVVAGVSNAMGGSVDLDGTTVTFNPDADACGPGTGSFEYEVSDGNGGSATAEVVVDVECVNDAPAPVDDDLSGTEDTAVVIDAADLAANDVDAEGDALTVVGLSQTSGGVVGLVNGTITFTPAANACGIGVAGFSYSVQDDNGGSATGHATIDLECVNDLPVAGDDFATVDNASGPADHAVLDNDTDAEGDTISLVDASVATSAGTASAEGDLVRFTPAAGFSGEAVVTYTISDGTDSATGTLRVTVGPDVTAPMVSAATAAFGKGRVDETAPLKISWAGVDASTGMNGFEVQVSIAGGTWKHVYAGPSTSITKLYPFGKSLVWRVRATDKAGNTSAWVSSATRKLVAYQNSSSKITKRGTWNKVSSSGSSGTGYAATKGKGNRMTLGFTGRGVLYVAPKTAGASWVKVYVDGVLLGRYNLYRSSTLLGQQIAAKGWTANGSHTIRIVSDTSTKRTNMDAFIVLK